MKLSILPLALLLLTSCTFVGKDDWGSLDRDGDGFMSMDNPEGDDCDDENPAVHPGAIEVCNGVDDDCEGSIDEGATDANTWFTDSDGDSFGDDSRTVSACEGPEGTVAVGGDCDDEEPSVYPEAPEICDHLDNDCDSFTDDDDSGVTGATAWYRDSDGDEYGDPADNVIGCEQPPDYIADGTDCDDELNSVHPVAEEIVDDSVDQDCDGGDACYGDSDLDGYGSTTVIASKNLDCQDEGESGTADDCDDSSAGSNPGATEYCDETDNDCDGATDEDDAADAAVWYRDMDEDAFGDAAATLTACAAPKGYVANDDDCDDSQTDIHPDATESVADGVDQDCDAGDACYGDSDGDGYGSTAVVTSADLDCSDAGEASVAGDCDDGSFAVHPGAVEYCDDIDNDCDGAVDEDDALDALVWYRDTDGDGYGDSADTVSACSIPSEYTEDGGDCDDALADVYPGGEEVCNNGVDDNCDGSSAPFGVVGEISLSTADARISGAGSGAGSAVGIGDFDRDGVNDVAIGVYGSSISGSGSGAVYITPGPILSTAELSLATAIITGEGSHDEAGGALAASDLDGDGFPDIIVGAGQNDGSGYMSGAAYIVLSPIVGTVDLSSAYSKLSGETEWDQAGLSVATGDMNGDGVNDAVVGACGNDSGGSSSGAAYIVIGPSPGSINLSSAYAKFIGENSDDYAGFYVATADIDGDGVDDVLIGAVGADSPSAETGAGVAYIVYGPTSGSLSLSLADVKLVGENAGDHAGVVASGDIDGDGTMDVLIGAPSYDGTGNSVGAAYLVLGPHHGIIDLSTANAKLVGERDYDDAGEPICSGDVDSDGFDDAIVGATTAGPLDSGAAYVFSGPLSGSMSLAAADAIIMGENHDDRAGYSLLGDDVNGDDADDVLVGARAWNSGAGAVYLLLGGGM